jgi:hypothetical protein
MVVHGPPHLDKRAGDKRNDLLALHYIVALRLPYGEQLDERGDALGEGHITVVVLILVAIHDGEDEALSVKDEGGFLWTFSRES